MAKWLAKEFDWDTGRYTGRYYDIAEPGIVAVFVDSFYGDDASADPEDPDLPLKTLGAAITYLNTNGADGSRIFMNGIFSETLPTQTYWYRFIGCGGGWNGRTVFYASASFIAINKRFSILENIITINYNDNVLVAWGSGEWMYLYTLNCILRNCRIGNNYGSMVWAYKTVFDYVGFYRWNQERYGGRINGEYNLILEVYSFAGSGSSWIGVANSYIGIRGGGTWHVTNVASNKSDVDPQFLNPNNNDFNVRITSPLIGTGSVDEISGIANNIGGVKLGLPYNGITPEFTTEGGATITDLTIDASGKFTITAPATTGSLETALMDLGNIYPLENIDLFNVFDFLSGEITQGVFETFSSPRMALTIKLKYGLTSAEVDDCPWLLIEYGKQPTFSGTGASRVGNAADTFDPDTFQEITCRYMKLFITLQNNS